MSIKIERDVIREINNPTPSGFSSALTRSFTKESGDSLSKDFAQETITKETFTKDFANDFRPRDPDKKEFKKFQKDFARDSKPPKDWGRDTPARHAHDAVKSAEQFASSVGESLTGGRSDVPIRGPKGYLMAYIRELENNPLRTKMLTAGALAGAQEVLASWLAKDIGKHGGYLTPRVPKMMAYGALVSAPLGHILIWCLQRAFRGRTSVKAKIVQILVSNLVMAPIQNAVYLIAMAIIAGARTQSQIRATVRVAFWKVMKVSWLTSPLCLAFAQKFLPDHLWVPFFNLVAFIIGTYINTVTKKKRLAALRKKHYGDQRAPSSGRDRPGAPSSVSGGRADTAASGSEHPDRYAPSHMGGPNPSY